MLRFGQISVSTGFLWVFGERMSQEIRILRHMGQVLGSVEALIGLT
jgi:hypothetical protein